MPEPSDPLSERLAAAPGLATLLAEAEATWLARAERAQTERAQTERAQTERAGTDADDDRDPDDRDPDDRDPDDHGGPNAIEIGAVRPGWRAFEDAFPTFYQFTNRPRT